MRKWETQDLVPIRPMEGEELPCNQVRLVWFSSTHQAGIHMKDRQIAWKVSNSTC